MRMTLGPLRWLGAWRTCCPPWCSDCPGLLDPGRTLEAAARHCDLAGLQAAWGLLWDTLEGPGHGLSFGSTQGLLLTHTSVHTTQDIWRRMLAAAAASSAPDAIAKMDWTLEQDFEVPAEVWGAAAASGDLSRLAWLGGEGFWEPNAEALFAAMQHADMAFVRELEEDDKLPLEDDLMVVGYSEDATVPAAASSKDSAAKLRWLAERGAALGSPTAVLASAKHGNLEALQLLLPECQQSLVASAAPRMFAVVLLAAVQSGSIATVAWLCQAGACLGPDLLFKAVQRGDLPMVRWLLQAGCPRGGLSLTSAVRLWPSNTPADSEALLQVVRLLRDEGWPVVLDATQHQQQVGFGTDLGAGSDHVLTAAAQEGHPWGVWRELLELLPPAEGQGRGVPREAAAAAAAAGCVATLEALVGLGVVEAGGGELATAWYVAAARNGDLGTLECLVRLGVPLGHRVLAAAVREGAPLSALKWLVEQGALWEADEVRGALDEFRSRHMLGSWCYGDQPEVEAWLAGLLLSAGSHGDEAVSGPSGEGPSGSGGAAAASSGARECRSAQSADGGKGMRLGHGATSSLALWRVWSQVSVGWREVAAVACLVLACWLYRSGV